MYIYIYMHIYIYITYINIYIYIYIPRLGGRRARIPTGPPREVPVSIVNKQRT